MFSGGYKKRLVVKRGLKVTNYSKHFGKSHGKEGHKGSSTKYVDKIFRKTNISN